MNKLIIAFIIGIILTAFVAIRVSNQITIKTPANRTLPPLGSGEVKPIADLWEIKQKCDIAQNRREYQDCLGSELKQLEAELDKEYDLSMKTLKENNPEGYDPEKDIENLKKTQNIWLSYKEMHCVSARDLGGPSPDGGSAGLECKITLTIERIRAIQIVYGQK